MDLDLTRRAAFLEYWRRRLLSLPWEFAARGRGIPFPIDHPKQLVVSGLYRYVRNPMYVGVLTVLLGEVMIFRSLDLLIYTVSWFAFVHLNVVIWGRAPAAPQVWRFLHALS